MIVRYVDFQEQYRNTKDETLAAITGVFERGDFILGAEVEAFEREFAKISNVKHAIAVANGTDSLVMALTYLGVGPGDEVITAPNSWISSASSIALLGATPVFADVGEDFCIDPAEVQKNITSKTKAIMPVHLTGRCADLESICEIARKKGIPVLEDAAQAVMARIGKFTAGNAGVIGSFSLHPLKNLNAAGDAGILTTNDDKAAAHLRLLRNHGLKNRDEVDFWGYNSRLDTIQAAILRTRLKHLPEILEKRRNTAALYRAELSHLIQCPQEKPDEYHTYHTYVIQADRRDELRAFLQAREIETKIHYPIPIHLQKAAASLGKGRGSFPRTESQMGRILSLPIHQYLSNDQIHWVTQCIREFFCK